MSRPTGYGGQDSEWRALLWAGATAAAVILLLTAGVAIVWMLGGRPENLPVVAEQTPHTPTPRALSFSQRAATPPISTEVPETEASDPGDVPAIDPSIERGSGPVIEATPSLMSAPLEGDGAAESATILEASSEADFSPLASGSWAATETGLVNEGSNAVAEEWLRLATVSNPDFALEAEVRVDSVLATVCDQSFGLAGGSPSAGSVFGAGVIFPCAGDSPRARFTNATTWQDGYNADSLIAEAPFDPGDAWHTYRFELANGAMRLLVDGEEVLSGSSDPAIDPAASDVETGIWSQGIGLEVRRVTIVAPAE